MGHVRNNIGNPSWVADIGKSSQPIQFKVNTRAGVTVMSEREFNNYLKDKVTLTETDKELFGPEKAGKPVVGKFVATMTCKGRKETIYVIGGNKKGKANDSVCQRCGR